MTDDDNAPETGIRGRPRKRSTLLVPGAVLFVVAMLLYAESIPAALHWPVRIAFFGAVAWLAFLAGRKLCTAKWEAKKLVFSLILVAFLYGALYLVCSVFVKLMAARDERLATSKTTELTDKARKRIRKLLKGDHPAAFDADIGWVPRPGFEWGIHNISEQGLRGTRVYPEQAPDPAKRILCIGDSFTFGYEVEDDQTFPHHGEQLLPGTEWINMGITGTGLTQSLMRYRTSGRKFGGKYVVIAFMTNNGKRTVNCFRPFVSPNDITPFAQPFASYVDGEFSIEPNPYQDISDYERLLSNEEEELKRLYEMDYFTWSNQRTATNPIIRTMRYVSERRGIPRNMAILLNRGIDDKYGAFRRGDDPYGSSIWHPESLGCQAILKTFDLYHEEVLADDRVPLIVILPSGRDVGDRIAGRPPKHASFLDHFRERGYRHIDFLDTLEETHGEKLTAELPFVRTHLNGESNQLLAETIIEAFDLN